MICKLLIIILIIIFLSYNTEEFCVNNQFATKNDNGTIRKINPENGNLGDPDECFYDNLTNSQTCNEGCSNIIMENESITASLAVSCAYYYQ